MTRKAWIPRWSAFAAIAGAVLWIGGFVESWNYEGELPTWVDALLIVELIAFLVGTISFVGSSLVLLNKRSRT